MADDSTSKSYTDLKQSNSNNSTHQLSSELPPPHIPKYINKKQQSQTHLPQYNAHTRAKSNSIHAPDEIKEVTSSKTPITEYSPHAHLQSYTSFGTDFTATTPCSVPSNPSFPDTNKPFICDDSCVENIAANTTTQYSTNTQQTQNNTNTKTTSDNNSSSNNSNGGSSNSGGGNHINNGWNRWHGRNDDGDDEKKRENNKYMDTTFSDCIKEEKKEENESKTCNMSNLRVEAHTFVPSEQRELEQSKSATATATLKTIVEHDILDPVWSKSVSAPLPCKPAPICTNCRMKVTKQYLYHPNAVYAARGMIKISKILTLTVVPNMVRETIQNVYDFMDKKTALNAYGGHVYEFADFRIYNYGFHNQSGQVLYCIADRINAANHSNYKYNMRDTLYTKSEAMQEVFMYDGYRLAERDLPDVSQVCAADIAAIYAQFEDAAGLCQRVIFKAKWHKMQVFNTMDQNKNFHKRRLTYSIQKNEFINIIEQEVHNKVLIVPIVMFNNNGYRVEYVQIVALRDNIDIGIAYIFDTNTGLEVTAIHLDKNSILKQHQLAAPYHDCHCLDGFKSDIDDLNIGNPDDDRNRVKDLKRQNQKLRSKLDDALDRIKQLECWNNITPKTISTLSPYTARSTAPNTPFRTPQSFYSNTPQSVSSHSSVGNQQMSVHPMLLMQNQSNYNTLYKK